MEILTVEERLARLGAFGEWLKTRGLTAAPTRLGRYIKTLGRLAPILTNGRKPSHEDFDTYLFTLREVDELLWVYKGLLTAEPPGIVGTLEIALGGRTLSREDSNSTARNYFFELRIASYFLQAGFEVDLAQDADLTIQLKDEALLHVECKRPESATKVRRRAKDALAQLQRRFATNPDIRSFGLVAIDVGRLLHPGQGLAIGATEEHGRRVIQSQLLRFDEEHQLAAVFRSEKRVVSVWLQVITPFLHVSEARPATRFSSLHLPLVPDSGERTRVFDEMRAAFEIE